MKKQEKSEKSRLNLKNVQAKETRVRTFERSMCLKRDQLEEQS